MAKLINVGEYQNDSERWAAEFLEKHLPDDFTIFANVDVFDDYGFRLDCDQIILGKYAVYVVEVKGYSGKIEAGKDDWVLSGGKIFRSPVSPTTTKAKSLASRIRERMAGRRIHTPWCQPVVFVTGGLGGEVELKLEGNRDPVFDQNGIVEALQSPDFLNTKHRNPLDSDQRELAQRVITNLRLLRHRPAKVGSFEGLREIGRTGQIRVCEATLKVGTLERKFLLRMAESYAYDHPDLWRADCQVLTEEARLYHELETVPGVPYAAPLIEEDESVTFAISYPTGKRLSALKSDDLDNRFRLDVLEAVSVTLQLIHQRGMAHGGLSPDWIFATDGASVEILNLSPSPAPDGEWAAPETLDGQNIAPASDVYTLARIFAPWFGEMTNDGFFEPGADLDESFQPLVEWLRAALDHDPKQRPEMVDLVRALRRMELGIAAPTPESETPFERESGATLHGTYRLEDSLGEGPAGEVWRARHHRGNYPLAVYFVDAGNESFLHSRFEEIASLHHPMIVRAYDMRRVPGAESLYMAADWFGGEPVDQLLESRELPDQDTLIGWFRDLLVALEFVHAHGVLHRNISPDAIIIVQGRPRLVEFSLLPETDRRAGLIEYTDPRVAETGWSRESDLYALAATSLNLFAGITPRTRGGSTLGTEQIERNLPVDLPATLRRGLIRVLSPEFELESDCYVELFGLQEPPRVLEKLPDEFLKRWGLSLTGHQERIARFIIREFHGKEGGRARARNQVVRGSLALTDVRANQTLRASANAAISALVGKGVLYSPPGTKAVRPTEEFLESWGERCGSQSQ